MAQCGIMRIEKRGRGAVHGLQLEANREKEDHERGRDFDRSDIDWDKTDENIHLVRTEHWNSEITRQIHEAGLKERKNSTVLLDGLYTASREWFDAHTPDEWMDYFRDCLDFHRREFCAGDGSRIINAVVHLDEATPHMQVASVPIFEDEKGAHLSAKVLCGGRQDFRLHQDHFFEEVAQERGLERGEVREWGDIKAHTTKREYQLATQDAELERREEMLHRTQQEQERVQEQVREQEQELERREEELRRTQQEQERVQEQVWEQEQELERTRKKQENAEKTLDKLHATIKTVDAKRMQALRERDAARAGRDVEQELQKLQKAVDSPASPQVEILAEYEAKKPLFGQETPQAVKIAKADLARLQSQARVNEQTRRAAASLDASLRDMRQAAADANENQIDRQAAANAAAVSEAGKRASALEHEVSRLKRSLQKEQEKTAKISAELMREQERTRETREILARFPDEWDRMQKRTARAREYERAYEDAYKGGYGKSYITFEWERVDVISFLRDYVEECRRQDIPPKKEMQEHLENYSRHRSRDRGISL